MAKALAWVPPPRDVSSPPNPPEFMPTRNVTLFGNRVFGDAVGQGSQDATIPNLGCALNPMAGVLTRGEDSGRPAYAGREVTRRRRQRLG